MLAVKVRNTEAPGLKPSQEPELTAGGGGGFGGSSSSSSVRQVTVQKFQQGGGSGSVRSVDGSSRSHYSARHQTIENVIQNLQSHFDETLYDETGLTGSFDVSLQWERAGDPASTATAIKVAILEQLGLELVPGRAQVEMLIVEKAEQ